MGSSIRNLSLKILILCMGLYSLARRLNARFVCRSNQVLLDSMVAYSLVRVVFLVRICIKGLCLDFNFHCFLGGGTHLLLWALLEMVMIY